MIQFRKFQILKLEIINDLLSMIKQIEEKEFHQMYLIHGTEDLLILEAQDELKEAMHIILVLQNAQILFWYKIKLGWGFCRLKSHLFMKKDH